MGVYSVCDVLCIFGNFLLMFVCECVLMLDEVNDVLKVV